MVCHNLQVKLLLKFLILTSHPQRFITLDPLVGLSDAFSMEKKKQWCQWVMTLTKMHIYLRICLPRDKHVKMKTWREVPKLTQLHRIKLSYFTESNCKLHCYFYVSSRKKKKKMQIKPWRAIDCKIHSNFRNVKNWRKCLP